MMGSRVKTRKKVIVYKKTLTCLIMVICLVWASLGSTSFRMDLVYRELRPCHREAKPEEEEDRGTDENGGL